MILSVVPKSCDDDCVACDFVKQTEMSHSGHPHVWVIGGLVKRWIKSDLVGFFVT